MIITIRITLLLLALVCFILAAVGVKFGSLNVQSTGLALLTASMIW